MKIFDENGNDLTPLPMIIEDRKLRQLEKENVRFLLLYFCLTLRQLSFYDSPHRHLICQSFKRPQSSTTAQRFPDPH